MSLRSWKSEYYRSILKASKDTLLAIDHSIKKWEGLRPSALQKHNLTAPFDTKSLFSKRGDTKFKVSGKTCALCRMTQKETRGNVECSICPLYTLTKVHCDQFNGPWNVWVNKRDPEPMLKALIRLKEVYTKKQKDEANG